MPPSIPAADANRALQALGVTENEVDRISRAPFVQAQELLQDLKVKARKQYKRLALELHPDRTNGDEVKAAFFVLLGRVLEDIEKTQVRPAPPPPMPIIHFHTTIPWTGTVNVGTWVNAPSSTTTSTAGFSPAQVIRIVKMRPK